MPLMRLDKFICDCGAASRREIKQLIKAGRVTLNGETAAAPETKLDPETAVVSIDGTALKYEKFHYFMLNKPAGVLSATDDGKQKTVIDLFSPEHKRLGLFPAGRLDKDTTGLLLITDDGDFAHKVISPKSEIEKLYHAETATPVNDDDIAAFAQGVTLADGTKCLPAGLSLCPDGSCLVTVMEGKYHQVKRMLASRGKPVTALKRLRIGALELDESLKPGEYRPLTAYELCSVMKKK